MGNSELSYEGRPDDIASDFQEMPRSERGDPEQLMVCKSAEIETISLANAYVTQECQ